MTRQTFTFHEIMQQPLEIINTIIGYLPMFEPDGVFVTKTTLILTAGRLGAGKCLGVDMVLAG